MSEMVAVVLITYDDGYGESPWNFTICSDTMLWDYFHWDHWKSSITQKVSIQYV